MGGSIQDDNNIPGIIRDFDYMLRSAYVEGLAQIMEEVQEIFLRLGADTVVDYVTGKIFTRWPMIKPETVRRKRGETTILIDYGFLRNSIKAVDTIAQVGHHEGKVGIFSGPALEYARIHEYGGHIRMTVTQPMRNFFLFMFLDEARRTGKDPNEEFEDFDWKPLKSTTTSIHIIMPERSYLRRGLVKATEGIIRTFITLLDLLLRGRFSLPKTLRGEQ